jgi:hypothetical protein
MNLLTRLATGRNILILLLIFLLFNLVLIPRFYPAFQTLDTLPSYTPAQAYQLLDSYGDAGRSAYLATELTLDLVYPPATALLFSLLIVYTFQRAFPRTPSLIFLGLIPFLVLVGDYMENVLIILMLLRHPVQLTAIARLAGYFTRMKFIFTPFELIFIIGLGGWLVQTIRSWRNIASHAGH